MSAGPAAVKRARRLAGGLLGLAFAALLCYEGWIFVRVVWWRSHNPTSTSFIRARERELRAKDPRASIALAWVPYGRISVHLRRAVVAAEDTAFLDHEGFDWEEIQKAYEKNVRQGRIVRGGSTISQQLAKNLFLSRSRTPWRKGEEVLITLMLESVLDKRRILEIYLNVIEWGERTFGAEAAARRYYGASAATLSPDQAAHLAAMIPNPRSYERRGTTPFLARQTARVRARMEQVRVP